MIFNESANSPLFISKAYKYLMLGLILLVFQIQILKILYNFELLSIEYCLFFTWSRKRTNDLKLRAVSIKKFRTWINLVQRKENLLKGV